MRGSGSFDQRYAPLLVPYALLCEELQVAPAKLSRKSALQSGLICMWQRRVLPGVLLGHNTAALLQLGNREVRRAVEQVVDATDLFTGAVDSAKSSCDCCCRS